MMLFDICKWIERLFKLHIPWQIPTKRDSQPCTIDTWRKLDHHSVSDNSRTQFKLNTCFLTMIQLCFKFSERWQASKTAYIVNSQQLY